MEVSICASREDGSEETFLKTNILANLGTQFVSTISATFAPGAGTFKVGMCAAKALPGSNVSVAVLSGFVLVSN
jgi:hypothetical protein